MRKNYLAQILSFMLVLCMMAAFVPAAAAEDTAEETKTGIKIVYDFDEFESGIELQDITYENSGGRMEFTKESDDDEADTVTANGDAEVNLNDESDYLAFKLKIPKQAMYAVRIKYLCVDEGSSVSVGFLTLTDETKRYYNGTRRFIQIGTSKSENSGMDENGYATVETTQVLVTSTGVTVPSTSSDRYQGQDEVIVSVWSNETDSQVYLKSIELLEVDPDTGEVYGNLETIPMCGDVTASVSTLTGETPEAELSLTNAYMSDGTVATEEDLAEVTYKSSDESIIAIENGKAVAKSAGTATISAYFGDLLLGSTKLSAEVSGEKLLYTFDMGVATMQEISYENSHGRLAWHGTNSTRNQNINSGIYARVNLDTAANGQYYYDAFKIRVPKNTTYNMDVTYVHPAAGGPIMGVWILQADTTDIGTVVYNGGSSKPDVKIDTSSEPGVDEEKTVSGSFTSGEEEEYLLVFARTGEGSNRGLSIKSVELSGGTIPGPIPFYGEVSFDKSYLENKNDTATVSIANKYLSDGTEGTFDVTYASSDESVATVSGSTITAKGAGTATIYAYSGDFAVGSKDIDVAATNEDGNPTKAEDGVTASTTSEVFKLTAVLGKETKTEVGEITDRNADGSVTVTAAPTDGEGNVFLYWAKGLKEGAAEKVFLPDEGEEYSCTFKPSTGMNYIIAVYGDPNAAVENKYFNANGQLLDTPKDENDLPSMPGYGTAKRFAECGSGIHIAEYDPAKEVTYTITENNHGTVNTYSKKFGAEVPLTAADASDGEYFRFWKKKAADGSVEIVSFDKNYTFYAFENCEVTAVYSAYEGTFAATFRKIILTNLYDNQFMAEFIGFGDAVEKGIAIGTNKIAMTTDLTQFTLDAETTEGVKGYAIDEEGNVYYAD